MRTEGANDEEFVYASLGEDPGSLRRNLIYLVALLVLAGLVWAAYFELDEVATATGKVIPASRGQVVQVFEAGIVEEVAVKEGDRVVKGQILLRLDDTRAGPAYREVFEKRQALSARAARLRAEAYGGDLDFPPEVRDDSELIKIETNALNARRSALFEQLAALEVQRDAMSREIDLIEPLVKRGVVSEVELLRLKRQAAELQGQMAQLNTNFLSRASDELVEVESELGQLNESLIGFQEALARTVLYSPIEGVVKNISVTTIGGTVSSGQVIMELVPVNDDLLVEAFMPPTEVAYVDIGQPAKVKLSAFDDRRYGNLDGEVVLISPDVLIEDAKGGTKADPTSVNLEPGFYKLLVRIINPGVTRNGMSLTPKPGMTATVDILTGKKTVLDYIFKPVQALKESMRER